MTGVDGQVTALKTTIYFIEHDKQDMTYQTVQPHKKDMEWRWGPQQPLRRGFLLIPIAGALTWLAVSPARAVTPAPDGGYSGQNTAEGQDALKSLTIGRYNTAIGFNALFNNSIAHENTAIGADALLNNTTGNANTALGFFALKDSTTAHDNTAIGIGALQHNTTGSFNSAIGGSALQFNTTGGSNTATGNYALQYNTTGENNTAIGLDGLFHNTNGSFNTADGDGALQKNTTGGTNTALGFAALSSNTTGGGNIALGSQAGQNLTTGNSNIDIGNQGVAGESSTIRIGAVETHNVTFIAGIRGATVPSGVGVIVGTNGQLGMVTSSARFKEAIKPMGKASEAILALKPVTFRYRHKLDPDGIAVWPGRRAGGKGQPRFGGARSPRKGDHRAL